MSESLNQQIDRLQAIFRSDLDPDGRGFVPLADVHRRLGDMDQALALVREGLQEHPDLTSGHVVEGWIHRAQGDIDTALKSFERVVELDPDNAIAKLAVAELIDDVRARTYREKIEAQKLAAQDLEATEEEGTTEGETQPATEDRVVVPVASLAPDERPVVPIASLAPDDRPVVPVADLVPDDSPVVPVADLAPDDSPVVPVASLAPDDEPELAVPDSTHVDSAPVESTPAEEPAADSMPAEQPSVAEELSPESPSDDGDIYKIYTRTLAELYAGQGGIDKSVEVYRKLVSDDPANTDLAQRLDELENFVPGEGAVVPIESLAPDSADGDGSSAGQRVVVPIGLLAPDDASFDETSGRPSR